MRLSDLIFKDSVATHVVVVASEWLLRRGASNGLLLLAAAVHLLTDIAKYDILAGPPPSRGETALRDPHPLVGGGIGALCTAPEYAGFCAAQRYLLVYISRQVQLVTRINGWAELWQSYTVVL